MKFAEPNKFEFTKDIAKRTITLVTHDAITTLYVGDKLSLKDFAQTYDFFLDFSVSQLPKTMGQVCNSIPGACIMSELKPGVVYDDRHKPEFFINRKGKQVNRDRWSDGMTWEEWCSDEVIAQEFYSRKQNWAAKKKTFEVEEDERPVLDDDWVAPVRPERKFETKPTPKPDVDKSLGDLLDGIL
jgi:hypothetical protein